MDLLGLIFPKRCVGCKRIGKYFCENCVNNILQNHLICPFCYQFSPAGMVHPGCERDDGLDGLWSLGVYKDLLRVAIQKLKYRFVKSIAEELIGITVEYWEKYQPYLFDLIKKDRGKDWVIIPVPLHKKRQNWRGFNQSAELAKILSKKLGLDYSEALVRTRNTRQQVGLEASKRRENIKGAFSFNTKYISRNTNVILVDDVWTTGSTLKECCAVLKKDGAKQVWGLTIAR